MKFEEVEKLTADEVRVAVAKAQGYSVFATGISPAVWVCDPHDCKHYIETENKVEALLKVACDIRDPRMYMELMNDLWKKEGNIAFDSWSIGWNWLGLPFGFADYIEYGPDKEVKDLWEAIARAWLVICG